MIEAVILNLDGVLVTTDSCHYEAWLEMAKEYGIPFDREIYQKIRGLSRMDGLNLILRKVHRVYSPGEKWALAARKNDLYLEHIEKLGRDCILPGALETIRLLKARGLKIAVGSSSQNAQFILKRLGMHGCFDAVADGNQIENLKPDPEVFLLAAKKLKVKPGHCLVVEDSPEGIEAARRGGMKAMGVGPAALSPLADFRFRSLAEADFPSVLASIQAEREDAIYNH